MFEVRLRGLSLGPNAKGDNAIRCNLALGTRYAADLPAESS